MQKFPKISKISGSFLARIRIFIGNVFIVLGYLFIVPFVIICVVFPPLWVPAGIIFAILTYFLSKSTIQQRTLLLKTIGLSLFVFVSFCAVKFSTIVGYDDSLNGSNVKTYQINNWGWDHDNNNNTEYVNKAIARLGNLAYGMKFGKLMDSQKDYQTKQYALAHPTPKPTIEPPSQVAEEKRQARNYAKGWWISRQNEFSSVDSLMHSAAAAANQGDELLTYQYLNQASNVAGEIRIENAPEGWDDVTDHLMSGVFEIKHSIDQWKEYMRNHDISQAADAKQSSDDATAQIQVASVNFSAHWLELGGTSKELLNSQ